MKNPTAPPPLSSRIAVRQATSDEAHPLLTDMINAAFKHYNELFAKDLAADRVTKDGKQDHALRIQQLTGDLFAWNRYATGPPVIVGSLHVSCFGHCINQPSSRF
ncbi:unnamed protein product, partial [Ectocarpus sp. 13 AM-2016]